MKFLVVFALFALATARPNYNIDNIHVGAEPVQIYEPILVGPALIDFTPDQAIGSIDKEALLDLLRRLRERLADLINRPIHVGSEPIVAPEVAIRPPEGAFDALVEWIRAALERIWPDGIPRPPRPPAGTLEAVREWLLDVIDRIWPDGIPRPPRPPAGTLEAIIEWIRRLIQQLEGQPISLEPVLIDSPPASPASSPLVQIIVNVKGFQSGVSPVVVEGLDKPEPVEPVIVVDENEAVPEVVIVDEAHMEVDPVLVAPIVIGETEPAPEVVIVDEAHVEVDPVIVAPIAFEPIVVAPVILN